jgi:hypothetical protein
MHRQKTVEQHRPFEHVSILTDTFLSNFDNSNPNVQLHTAALYDPAAEEMVIALVEANDLARVRGLSRPWPVYAAGASHLSKISTLQLIELELPAVLLVCRESVISIG